MSLKHRGRAKGDPVTYQTPLPAGGVQMETFLPWTLVRRGLKKQIGITSSTVLIGSPTCSASSCAEVRLQPTPRCGSGCPG